MVMFRVTVKVRSCLGLGLVLAKEVLYIVGLGSELLNRIP